MILSDRDIRAACKMEQGGISIKPFSERLIQPASYDLRVGRQAASSAHKKITDLEKTGFVEIKPGDFVLVTTCEKLTMGARHVGRFGLTSTYARKGIIATVGAQVDPGFRGRLIVGLTNLSAKSIALPYKDTFLTIEFHRLEKEVEVEYAGPYQDRDALSPDDIKAVMEREYMSQTEMMRTLEALVTTVDGLKWSIAWQLPLIFGTIVTVGVASSFVLVKFL